MEVLQMNVTTDWVDGHAFVSKGDSNFEITLSSNVEGYAVAPTPAEAILSALASCTGIDMIVILKNYSDKITRFSIQTEGIRFDAPPKGFENITLTYHIDGDIAAQKVLFALKSSREKYCMVADSLKATIDYRVILNGELVA